MHSSVCICFAHTWVHIYVHTLFLHKYTEPSICIEFMYAYLCMNMFCACTSTHICIFSLSIHTHTQTHKKQPKSLLSNGHNIFKRLIAQPLFSWHSCCAFDSSVCFLSLLQVPWALWLCWLCSWASTSGPSECKLHSFVSFFSLFSGVCDTLLSRESQKMTLNCWLKNNPSECGVHLSIYIQEICFSVSVDLLLVFNILFKTGLFCLCVEKLFLDCHVDIYMHENLIWEKVFMSKRMKSITDIYKIYNLNQNIY